MLFEERSGTWATEVEKEEEEEDIERGVGVN